MAVFTSSRLAGPRRPVLVTLGFVLGVGAAILPASAAPALALDVTGTWSGKRSCRQQAGAGVTRRVQRDSTMRITQRGEGLFIEIDGAEYRGRRDDSDRNLRRARGSAVRCADDGEACTPTSDVLDLKIKARGTMRITATSTAYASGGWHCSYRFGRTSREDPGVPRHSTSCEPLDVSGHWEGTWISGVTGENGQVVADLSQTGEFVFGLISFPPFGDTNYSPPFLQMGTCAPAEFSTGAILPSGVAGTLDGIATNTSMAGTWGMSDASDHGTWHLSRPASGGGGCR